MSALTLLGTVYFLGGALILMNCKRPGDPGKRTFKDVLWFFFGLLLVQLGGGIAYRDVF